MSPPTELSRREMLRASIFATGALALPSVLAACSKEPSTSSTPRTLDELTQARVAAGATEGLSVFLAGEDYVSGANNYVAFGLVEGNAPIMDAEATVWISTFGGLPEGPFSAPWGGYAKPDAPAPAPQGINATDLRFGQPVIWQALVEVAAQGKRVVGTTVIPVKAVADASTRTVGERSLPSATPTVGRPRGVDPICTRTPACAFHEITLADAIASGKPTAFIVATPRFCMSRTCGPNLEELILVAETIGDRANFVHAEVYRSDDPDDIRRQVVSPTFLAWSFQTEPWLFLIDPDGIIADRFEGPIVASTIQPALERLLGP